MAIMFQCSVVLTLIFRLYHSQFKSGIRCGLFTDIATTDRTNISRVNNSLKDCLRYDGLIMPNV